MFNFPRNSFADSTDTKTSSNKTYFMNGVLYPIPSKKVGEDKEMHENVPSADSDGKFFAIVKPIGFDFTPEV